MSETRSSNWSQEDGTETVSHAVVTAVARTTDRDETDLEPLFGALDPDALEELVGPTRAGRDGPNVTVSFEYAGCRVNASSDGEVVVSETDGPAR